LSSLTLLSRVGTAERAGGRHFRTDHLGGGAVRDGLLTLLFRSFTAPCEDSGASVVDGSIGSPAKLSHAGLVLLEEGVVDLVEHDDALGRAAHLAGIPVAAGDGHCTALSRSASASTTKASAPPSSIVDFFSALPACAATTAPAPSEPVRATPVRAGLR
jgi:hypothetical protein